MDMVNYAAARAFRRMSWRTALKITAAAAILGAGLLTACAIIDAHTHVAERRTTAEVLAVTNCNREVCGYSLSYTDSHGMPEFASIPGPQGEARPFSKTVVYYQDANPGAARFPDTDYESSNLNTFIGLSVLLILFAMVMLLVTLVKGIVAYRQR